MGDSQLIAVVFTDLVDSTALLVSLSSEAGARFRRRHFGHLRRTTARFSGEVVKSTGDGVMATFPSASAAVQAAVAMQQLVGVGDETAAAAMRIGLSVGDAVREEGDWYGIPVIEAARLCAAAAPGQILATQLVGVLAAGRGETSYRAIGPVALKGLPAPVEVIDVTWERAAPPRMAELPPPVGCLAGRDDELLTLQRVVESGDKQLRVAVVEGEAGIGKSTLLAEVARGAASSGVQVFVGGGDELERARPLRALIQAFSVRSAGDAGMRGELARMLAPAHATENDLTYALATAAVDLLEEVATAGPALLVVEDLHWVDAVTVMALRQAATRLRELPITVITTARPGEGSKEADATVAELRRVAAAEVSLKPLDVAALQALAANLLGRAPGPVLTRWLERAGGNPLYAVELLRALTASDMFGSDGDLREDSSVPTSAGAAIRGRLRFLPDATLGLLEVASVVGREFAVQDLAHASGGTAVDTLATLRPALVANIIEDRGDAVRFTHDLVREAVYTGLPTSGRHALHRSIAASLLRTGASPAAAAAHLLMASAQADDETLDLLLATGAELRQVAPALALELFQRGVDVTGPRHPRYRAFVRAMLWPLVLRGQFEAVDLLLDGLRAGSSPLEMDADATIREAVVYRHLRRGRTDLFRAELERLHAADLDPASRGWVESRLLIARIFEGDAGAAALLRDEVLQHSRTTTDERLRAYCLTVLTVLHCALGDVRGALPIAAEAEVLHSRLLGNVALVYLFVALAYIDADRFEDAVVAIHAGLKEDMEEGDTSSLAVQHWMLGFLRYLAGDWDAALTEAETGLDLFDEGGQTSTGIMYGFAVLGRIALHRDDVTAAEAFVARAEELARQGVSALGFEMILWVKGLALEARGRMAEAWTAGHRGWRLTAGIRYFISWRSTTPDLLRWAIAAGDADGASDLTEAVVEGARLAGVASAEAVALECEGLLSGRPELLVAAVDRYRLGPRTVAAARSATQAGKACAAAGNREGAVALLEEGLAIWSALDAPAEVSVCRAALRELGVRRGRAGDLPRRPSSGWESLTPAEDRVATLLAEGLTNRRIAERLFISPHTVDTHVRHILRKLEMSSRVEVAAEAARRDRYP